MGYRNKLFPQIAQSEPKRIFPTAKELRGTGKTTALALHYLGRALRFPGIEISVRDHTDTPAAHASCFHAAREMATKLELRYLTFNRAKLTVRYDVLEWVA